MPSDGMGTRLGARHAIRCFGAPRRHHSARVASDLRVCIVGSGPAGFYTAHQLVKVRTAKFDHHHVTKSGRVLRSATLPCGWTWWSGYLCRLGWSASVWHPTTQRSRFVLYCIEINCSSMTYDDVTLINVTTPCCLRTVPISLRAWLELSTVDSSATSQSAET